MRTLRLSVAISTFEPPLGSRARFIESVSVSALHFLIRWSNNFTLRLFDALAVLISGRLVLDYDASNRELLVDMALGRGGRFII